jgi:hypothetical protein
MKKMLLETYGITKFNPAKFQPIKNRTWANKPEGGLWATPVNSKFGWKQWCELQDFRTNLLKKKFEFYYVGNIVKIDSLKDAQNKLVWYPVDVNIPSITRKSINFDYMKYIGVDAIWITENGESETRFNYEYSMYGWDCESVLIMNPKGITFRKEKMYD